MRRLHRESSPNRFDDVKKYFGDWKKALFDRRRRHAGGIDQFMQHTTWAVMIHSGIPRSYGRRMVDMVGTSIYEWSSRVADYINYIKNLVQSLDDYITSLRLQLAQLRGDRMAELEMWYAQEKAKIDEQYKDLKDTQEYYDALALLLEVYKEKKKKILEEMKQDEEDAAASSESGGGLSASGGSSGGSGEQYCRILRITRPRSNRTSAICCRGCEFASSGGPGGKTEGGFTKTVQISADLNVTNNDKDYIRRLFEDDFWPMLRRKFELLGINMQKL